MSDEDDSLGLHAAQLGSAPQSALLALTRAFVVHAKALSLDPSAGTQLARDFTPLAGTSSNGDASASASEQTTQECLCRIQCGQAAVDATNAIAKVLAQVHSSSSAELAEAAEECAQAANVLALAAQVIVEQRLEERRQASAEPAQSDCERDSTAPLAQLTSTASASAAPTRSDTGEPKKKRGEKRAKDGMDGERDGAEEAKRVRLEAESVAVISSVIEAAETATQSPTAQHFQLGASTSVGPSASNGPSTSTSNGASTSAKAGAPPPATAAKQQQQDGHSEAQNNEPQRPTRQPPPWLTRAEVGRLRRYRGVRSVQDHNETSVFSWRWDHKNKLWQCRGLLECQDCKWGIDPDQAQGSVCPCCGGGRLKRKRCTSLAWLEQGQGRDQTVTLCALMKHGHVGLPSIRNLEQRRNKYLNGKQ